MTAEEMRICPGCGRQIPVAYNVCPHCGRPTVSPPLYGPQAYGLQPYGSQAYGQPPYGPQPYGPQAYGPQPYGPPQYQEKVGAVRYLFYLFSIFLFGYVLFLIWNDDPNSDKRRVSKNCLVISVFFAMLFATCLVAGLLA